MNYEYIVSDCVFSRRNPSILSFAVLLIRDGHGKRIQEHTRRSFKVHPVFAEIGLSLDRIPVEFIEKHCHVPTLSSRTRTRGQRAHGLLTPAWSLVPNRN